MNVDKTVGKALRSLAVLAAVALVTYVAKRVIPVNATTVSFAYFLLVLTIASTWGFVEALVASISSALVFNFFFLPPFGTLTIWDPENWVALFSFLATALVASRLSANAEQRARDAMERQRDLERLYTFSRAILLIESGEPFARQLARRLIETFGFNAAVLYDRRTASFYRDGPSEFNGMEDQLRDSALQGVSFADPQRLRVITAIRLGSEPIASLALQGVLMPDSVLQGIANLVAIGLERAAAQDLAHQVEAARQSEQLRTTLIDAMAHEFKTPLTSIKAATTSLLATPDLAADSRSELITIADEESDRLKDLIDNAIEMARLDTSRIEVDLQEVRVDELLREVVASLHHEIEQRPVEVAVDGPAPLIPLDRRLVKLAFKQLIDNALKYSPPASPVRIRIRQTGQAVGVEVTDQGKGIPESEQKRIFERFYRSPSAKRQVPGSGLGLTIANSIAQAHGGDLSVASRAGETTFTLTLPVAAKGAR
jgi:two-component system sensor histidine kinase KdpD